MYISFSPVKTNQRLRHPLRFDRHFIRYPEITAFVGSFWACAWLLFMGDVPNVVAALNDPTSPSSESDSDVTG